MAIAGIAIGSAGLLIALSIVHGFKTVIHDKIVGFGPEIVIQTFSDYPIYQSDTLITYLLNKPEIEFAQVVIESQAMIQVGEQVEGVILRGVENEDKITSLPHYIIAGQYLQSNDSLPKLIIGSHLKKEIGAQINSSAFIYSVRGVPSRLNPPDIKKAQIGGIYEFGIDKFDAAIVIAPINWTRELLRYIPHQADKIFIKTRKGVPVSSFSAKLNEGLPYPLHTETVFETYSSIFAWVNLQEQTIPLVIGVMIVVAAFNLIGTILMMILERTKDIGILKTMGANDFTIKMAFLLQGALIAIIGLFLGLVISFTFYWLQSNFNIIPLPQENYYMSTAPVEPHLSDVFWVSLITFSLALIASYIPSGVAARLNPLRIISFGKA